MIQTKHYLLQFRKLLKERKLDALVVYANGYDDRFMKAITGTFATLQNFLLITRKKLYLAVPKYLIADTKRRTKIELLSSEGEESIIFPIKKKLGTGKKIGLIGDCKHRDLIKLNSKKLIDLTPEAEEIISFKSNSYIKNLEKHAQKLVQIMDSIKIKPDMNQLTIAEETHKEVIENGYELGFICITSGKDLFETTTLSPRDKKIKTKDIVCVDMGIKKDIFTTDRTRMYFVNHPQAERLYAKIRLIHNTVIKKAVNQETKFSDVREEYKKRIESEPLIKKVLDEDFGHGIGFGLHETPVVEKTDREIGTSIVFTLEPTFVTKLGKMRIEDMVAVKSDGEVLNLTLSQ